MKEGWEIKSLGEIADVEYGFTDKSTEEGDYRYVRITDIDNNGELISTGKKYLKHSKEVASFLLQDNDLLMARTGATFAKVLLYEDVEPSVFASYLIRIKFKEKIDNKLYWYFSKTKSYWDQANSLASGAAQPHFNGAAVKQVIFSYPKSLPEQQRIVSILDEAFAAIAKAKANAEQNLKNAKELFESYLQGVFENGNWETKTFYEVCEISSKLIDPRKSEYQNLIHVGAGNIESMTGKLSDLKTAKEENLISGKFLFDESMVLYSKIRPYLMKVVNCDFQGLCSADIYPLKPFEKVITKDYLYHLLLTKEFTDYAILGSQRAGMPKVNREHLFAYSFKLPSINDQQSIVRQLDALRAETQKLEALYQKKIADLEELK
ncbi:MAG: restriction endonuclease subunit S [Cyclobacterium sp.]|nr:restriction endonuclease subunit S [Cyclobacterium sp.]